MKTETEPIVKEERPHPKKKFSSLNFSRFFAQAFMSKLVEGDAMFRGHNVGYENPIYSPKRTKFKGWMRERRRSTFNKNK